MSRVVISSYQVVPLIAAFERGERTMVTTPDLGRTQVAVELVEAGIRFASTLLSWENARRIASDTRKCYRVELGSVSEVVFFSKTTRLVRALYPTPGRPTMLVSGFPMHRIKDCDPAEDTLAKFRAVGPVAGDVLDTATGLGYTAIEAAKTARVTTIEIDPTALEVARLNPWSAELFDNPRIEQMVGDAVELVFTFETGRFDCIIHDPPTLSLAGQMYSTTFYAELNRVLRTGGKLFHYIGDPHGRHTSRTTEGAIRRLHEAGFSRVIRRPEAFGLAALK